MKNWIISEFCHTNAIVAVGLLSGKLCLFCALCPLVVYLDIGSGLANSQNNKPCFLLSSSKVGSSVALPCLPLSSKLSVGKTASLT